MARGALRAMIDAVTLASWRAPASIGVLLLLFAVVQFHHANIGLPDWLDRALRTVIVTPHLHKVHHSVVLAEQNANFSSLFSWWDRIAQTVRLAPDLSRVVFGVDDAAAVDSVHGATTPSAGPRRDRHA